MLKHRFFILNIQHIESNTLSQIMASSLFTFHHSHQHTTFNPQIIHAIFFQSSKQQLTIKSLKSTISTRSYNI